MTTERYLMSASGSKASYWIATLSGASDDTAYSVAVGSNDNLFIVGYTDNGTNYDVFIAKYNSSGALQWQRKLYGSYYDYGYGIAVDSSDNVYITGSTSNGTNDDVFIAKYNTSGTLQWQRKLSGSGDEYAFSIAVDGSGNAYITGQTYNGTDDDPFIAKYNTSGTLQWQRKLDGNSDYGIDIAVDGSGNVYIAGYAFNSSTGDNAFIAKYNTSGAIQWQRTLAGSGSGLDYGYGIAVDSSGNVYIVGQTYNGTNNDALIAKYNSSGTIQWQRTLSNAQNKFFNSITADGNGNVYSFGASYNGTSFDALIAKYNTSGTIQWQRTLGSLGSNYGYCVAVDTNGSLFITGQAVISDTTNDGYIAKLPDDGTLTGTYGPWTYAASSLTDAAGTLTDAAGTLTDAAGTLTDASSSLTDASASLTAAITPLKTSDYWIGTVGAVGYGDNAYSSVTDGSGNIYIGGYTDSSGAGSFDGVIVKLNSSGAIQWQRTIGGSSFDFISGLGIDGSGNVYAAGQYNYAGAFVTKYNSSGTIQWQKSLSGSGADYHNSVAVDGSGNVYCCGGTLISSTDAICVTKYNSTGVIQWHRTLNGSDGDYGRGVAVDSSGNVYITGNTLSIGAGSSDILIAKYNSSGTIQWQRTLGSSADDSVPGNHSITLDTSGNVYIAGYTRNSNNIDFDMLIAKYNASGTIQWQRKIAKFSESFQNSVAINTSGDIYISGTFVFESYKRAAFVVKYNSSGTLQWQRSIAYDPDNYYLFGKDVAVDDNGNVYITGYTELYDPSYYESMLVIKIPSDGSLTGTHGPFTYAATTLTDSTASLTDAAATLTDAAGTLTDATATLTDASCALGRTTQYIGV